MWTVACLITNFQEPLFYGKCELIDYNLIFGLSTTVINVVTQLHRSMPLDIYTYLLRRKLNILV